MVLLLAKLHFGSSSDVDFYSLESPIGVSESWLIIGKTKQARPIREISRHKSVLCGLTQSKVH